MEQTFKEYLKEGEDPNDIELTTTNAQGISVPMRDIASDKTNKDGVRVIKYSKDVFRNGYSAWNGTKKVTRYRIIKDGIEYDDSLRKGALADLAKYHDSNLKKKK